MNDLFYKFIEKLELMPDQMADNIVKKFKLDN